VVPVIRHIGHVLKVERTLATLGSCRRFHLFYLLRYQMWRLGGLRVQLGLTALELRKRTWHSENQIWLICQASGGRDRINQTMPAHVPSRTRNVTSGERYYFTDTRNP
jgi:hypothetical protein